MFFDEGLQSGIALALRESKSVTCFIRGTDSQSKLWETEYLRDDEVSQVLAAKAITLRMDAGSQEAEFLSAYYPISVTPSLVIIRGGQLLLDLRAGINKEQFKEEILRALGNDLRPYEPAVSSSTEVTTVRAGTTGAESASDAQALDPAPQSLAPTRTPPVLNNSTASTASSLARGASQTTSTVQDLLADRRHKLEVDKREKEAAEKAERRSEAEARRKAMEVEPESAQAKQASYAQQQRKRQQEARLERERIMRHIKSDKQARKEKEELRKTLSKAAAEGNDGAGGLVDQQLSSEVAGFRSMSTDCALQVRLLDGSTIRSKFNPDQTLRTNVRAWIDEQRCDGDIPYTFKQILTPLPNRNITISEEDESLRLLGLTPSATLVMVPVQGYTAAYSGDPNLISRGLSAGYNVVSVGVIMVTRVLGKILGPAQGQTPSQEPAKPAQTTPVKSNPRAQGTGNEINVRTLHDQRVGPDDHQLYNGNQLNFEPRRDRDDEVD